MKKILSITFAILFSQSALAYTESETYIIHKDFYTSEAGKSCGYNGTETKNKENDYLICKNGKWALNEYSSKISKYTVSIFRKEVSGNELVSANGVYEKDSPLVNIENDRKYDFMSHAEITALAKESNIFKVEREVAYVKESATKIKSNGSSTTHDTMGYLTDGLSINLIPIDNKLKVEINQERFIKMVKYGSGENIIEAPILYSWHINDLVSFKDNEVIRYDSSTYKKDGKIFRDVYLISKG